MIDDLPINAIAAHFIPFPERADRHQQPTLVELTAAILTAILRSHPNDDMLILPKRDCQMIAHICYRICKGDELTDKDGETYSLVCYEVHP